MPIRRGDVVAIDYILRDGDGVQIDASQEAPLQYLHGYGNIVPGLEGALDGAELGASLEVQVTPADGYGDHDPAQVQQVPRRALPPKLELEHGMQLMVRSPSGESFPVRVVAFDDEKVSLDANHPLAGVTLFFSVTVRSIRPASEEELSHGHVHGPGGHH